MHGGKHENYRSSGGVKYIGILFRGMMSYYHHHRGYDDDPYGDDPYLIQDEGDNSYSYANYDDRPRPSRRSGGGSRHPRHPSPRRKPSRRITPLHSIVKRVNHHDRPMGMSAGRPMIKPPPFMPNRKKSLFSGRGGRSPVRNREPRYEDYEEFAYDEHTNGDRPYMYEDRTWQDRTYYTNEYGGGDDDSFCEQRNDRDRTSRQTWQKSCGVPTKLCFCADDASREDVSETTDFAPNADKGVLARCMCFDQEFSFKVGVAEDDEEGKGDDGDDDEEVRDALIGGHMVHDQDNRFLIQEEPSARRGYGRKKLMKYVPLLPAIQSVRPKHNGREARGRRHMYDDATYASMDSSIDPSLNMGLLDDLAAASKCRWKRTISVLIPV